MQKLFYAMTFLCLFSLAALGVFPMIAGCGLPAARTPEQIHKAQTEEPPTLIATKNGISLWRTRDLEVGQYVYFTTPTGDVQWTVSGDEDNPDKHLQVSGAKGK